MLFFDVFECLGVGSVFAQTRSVSRAVSRLVDVSILLHLDSSYLLSIPIDVIDLCHELSLDD